MANRKDTLDKKIEKKKQEVLRAKDRYDALVEEFDQLIAKKREMESKELMEAIAHSSKTVEEVLAFLKEDDPDDTPARKSRRKNKT